MRYAFCGVFLWLTGLLFAQAPPEQPVRPLFTALVTDVSPEVRAGRTFVPVRTVSQHLGATVAWMPATREVRITRPDQPIIRLTINSRTAMVGDDTVTLEAAPFITQGRTMVPLRFIAETFAIPVEYHTPTRSVRVYHENRVYVLPLEDTRSGVFIFDPRPGELVRNPVRVQGQGNVFEGNLLVEVRDFSGRVLGSTFTTAGMGGFYPYSISVFYNQPLDDAIAGEIVVYSQNGRGTGQILARDSVRVILASTM